MAVQFRNGAVLFINGAVAMAPSCCCGAAGTCCTFDPARYLYLTIDEMDVPGFPELAAFGVAGKQSFGTASGSGMVTWFTFTCGDDGDSVVAFTLRCEAYEGFPVGTHWLNRFSGGVSFYYGDGCAEPPTHLIRIKGFDEPTIFDARLGIAVCSPFYIQATVEFFIVDSFGAVLGEGTMRVTITE